MKKQITEEQVELIVERLVDRVEKANLLFLKNIGESIKKVKGLTPSKAHQLIQMLRYGTKYNDIVKNLSKYTDKNIDEVDDIFNSYARKDLQFYKEFYDYRDKPFIPYKKNKVLQRQTNSLINMVKKEAYNFTRDNVLGYTINGKFFNLRETYNKVLDDALLNVGRGQITFDSAMRSILKDIGGSGLKTIEYESGRSIRLDSAVRMHLKGRLRELHNENQLIISKDIDADGVEISVHPNPAEDHEDAQGKQFTNKEFEKLQEIGIAKTYDGEVIDLHSKLKSESRSIDFRPISEFNCYHYIFSVVLGVNKPAYSKEQLEKIKKENEEGFEYEGKHYSMYEGTQLQRNIEREIRKNKDIQILARETGDNVLVNEAQQKISILTDKYNELSKVSGLPKKMDRLRVEGYKYLTKKNKM